MTDAKVIRKSIKQWPEKLATVNAEFLPTAAKIVLSDAKRRAPVKDGRLKSSLQSSVSRDRAAVGTNVGYAAYVEYGTRPHTISVNGAKVLTDKKTFFGKSVEHPGTTAQPYLRPAIDNNRKALVGLWRQIFRRVYNA